jgi:hypothetical protein
MLRRLACTAALASLVLVPAARADGPQADPGLMQGWTGVTAPGLAFRYVTLPGRSETVVAQVRRSTGRVWGFRSLAGIWGVPLVANDGTAAGLSPDHRLLVLANWIPPQNGPFRTRSQFAVLLTKNLRTWRRISLRGDFTFDALSPGGRMLFLIEHVRAKDLSSYRVRAYDLAARKLLPRVVADRRQASWVMRGYPVTRATTPDGRFDYTLYEQFGGYPFVHALDTVRQTAVCVGIPWKGDQSPLYSTRLQLDDRTLTLTTRAGRPLFLVDRRTYWVTRPRPRPAGFLSALLR